MGLENMSLIFDTSVLIELEKRNPFIIEQVRELQIAEVAQPLISFIVQYEFLYGQRKKNEENKKRGQIFLNFFEVLQTSSETVPILLQLREKYELPLADLLIAAQTIEVNGLLITKDKDFASIKELNVKLLQR